MALNKLLFIISPFILLLCSACNDQNKLETKIAGSIPKDIPLDKHGLPIRSYIFKNKIIEKTNLEMLENGFDSMQIRIWYSPTYVDSVYLMIVKRLNETWSAEFFRYRILFNKDRNTIDSIIESSSKVKPKSSWQFFLDKIFNLGITTLPDINAITEPYAMTEDGGIAIEVSTSIGYRFYHYLKSTLCDDRIIQAKKMQSIMELIYQEFDFVYPDCQ